MSTWDIIKAELALGAKVLTTTLSFWQHCILIYPSQSVDLPF